MIRDGGLGFEKEGRFCRLSLGVLLSGFGRCNVRKGRCKENVPWIKQAV